MGDIVYLTITGERQGNISLRCGTPASIGNRFQYRHEDEILCLSLAQLVSGSGQHAKFYGLQFSKLIDKCSPLLMNAINENERLTLNFDFYRTNRYGKLERYYHIELRGASIKQIRTCFGANEFDSETVNVNYEYIRCKHLVAGTEFSDLILPDNYNRLFPPAPPIVPAQPAQEITLTLGIFFDGTGNNAVNTQNMLEVFKAKHYQITDPDAVSILEKSAEEEMGITGVGAISYTGYYTNVYWLSTLYKTDLPLSLKGIQQGIYIEGIGTEQGKPDSVFGSGLGIYDTGVIAKTDKAVSQITPAMNLKVKDILNQILDEKLIVKNIQFDVFGFSRGATAARHFANRIQSEDPAIIAAIKQGLGSVTFTGSPAGKVRFIGIMDSVAAIGTPTNGLNPHSADTGEVNIQLRPGVAEKVFHITALNECRFNFALNSVRPAWPELALPGVHSDIGGGYLPVMRENVFLSRPRAETVLYDLPANKTRIYQETLDQLSEIAASTSTAPLLRTHKVTTKVWDTGITAPDRYGQRQKRTFAALTMLNRIVKNDWAKVVLRIMMEAAQEAGVKFNDSNKIKELFIPAELIPYLEKARQQAKAVRQGRFPIPFLTNEIDAIAKDYIHCSANWNAVKLDTDGAIHSGGQMTEILGFVNRPDVDWRRTIYNMDGKNR